MSFLSKLIIGDTEYNVLRTDYEISQSVDTQNKPNGKPRGGIISVTVESSNKNDLAEWMVSPTMKKNGQLVFFRRDANSSMKTLSFSEGYCIGYQETFDANSPDPMSIRLRISAGEIKLNNSCTVTNPWSTTAAALQDAANQLGIGNLFSPAVAAVSAAESAVAEKYNEAKAMKQEAAAKADEAAATAQAAEQQARQQAAAAQAEAQAQQKDMEKGATQKQAEAEQMAEEISSFIP
jgi:flagellar biosynthesis GTPase FlhF